MGLGEARPRLGVAVGVLDGKGVGVDGGGTVGTGTVGGAGVAGGTGVEATATG